MVSDNILLSSLLPLHLPGLILVSSLAFNQQRSPGCLGPWDKDPHTEGPGFKFPVNTGSAVGGREERKFSQ